MKYGIMPANSTIETYLWIFDSLETAKREALWIAEKHNCEVIVFRVRGSYVASIEWKEDSDDTIY